MSWASQRRFKYISILTAPPLLVFLVWLAFALQVEPTCFDGKQNQNEVGVDCGGVCTLLCRSQVAPVNIVWSRSFPINEEYYNAVAYIENPNFDVAVYEVPYIFILYDAEGILITERRGSTYIATNGVTPIFESRILVGNRTPARTEFRFEAPLAWRKLASPRDVEVQNQEVSNLDTEPRVTATISQTGLNELQELDVVAVIYDTRGNALLASQRLIEILPGQGTQTITFVWPRPLEEEVGRVDVIPLIPPIEQN